MIYKLKILMIAVSLPIFLNQQQRLASSRVSLLRDQHSYSTYINDRYRFHLLFPTDLLTSEIDPDGAGCRFSSRVIGGQEVTSLSMVTSGAEQRHEDEIARQYNNPHDLDFGDAIRTITYRRKKPNWYVKSGIVTNKRGQAEYQHIFYARTVCKNGVIAHLYLEYDKAEASKLKTVVTNISRSFDLSDRQPK